MAKMFEKIAGKVKKIPVQTKNLIYHTKYFKIISQKVS
jgi:hypothetical protein